MTFQRTALYLQVPETYCRWIGGLRWARYGDAVEFLDGPAGGMTFAFAPEIALFMEGFRHLEAGVPAFGHVLHLLYLVGVGDRLGSAGGKRRACLERIAGPFREEGCPLRNAGALCAALCADVPRAADPPELDAIHDILTDGNWVPSIVLTEPMTGAMPAAEEPGLDPERFEALVRRRLELLDDAVIRNWLRHGRTAIRSEMPHSIPIGPKSLSRAFSEIERRPRLAGTLALADRLEAVLSLPSRRLDRRELEGGGYSDITTRGAPERILPIQFALDGEEFLRRFAERELLYFHREDFHTPQSDELVILLDQGVRTWGDVRLFLAGAAVALVRQAGRRRIAVKLAVTGNDGEPIDPGAIEPGDLSALLESSDLSMHPGHTLRAVLAAPSAHRRDVVILTHPRSLLEPEVAAAARAGSGDRDADPRLFAVLVDSTGQLELAELRSGLPIVLARSRVELEPAPAVDPIPAPRQGPAIAWKGEFEPIGFPFRCGRLDSLERLKMSRNGVAVQSFDFDESGERILAVSFDRLLFTCRLDGTGVEHLPLPVHNGTPIVLERKAIGVGGGFVIPGYSNGQRVLAHYDFPARTCVIHRMGADMAVTAWSYFRDLHAIVLQPARADGPFVAVDLGARRSEASATERARRAVERARAGEQPHPVSAQPIWTSDSESWVDLSLRVLRLDADSGLLHYRLGPDLKKSVTPYSDGLPALKGGQIMRADRGGDVLAVQVRGCALPGLYFISTSSSNVIGVFPMDEEAGARTFALSRDGRRFAVLSGGYDLEVREVSGPETPVFVSPREDVAIHFASLGKSCLLIREATEDSRFVRDRFLLRWDRGLLELERAQVYSTFARLGGMVAESRSLSPSYDEAGTASRRFVQVLEHGRLRILIDRYNHFVIFDLQGNLVCIFYAVRDEVAALLVDGTFWGSRRLTGCEVLPGAAQRIARALLEAEGAPEKSS